MYSYATVETALSIAHHFREDMLGALRGRLKHFQRLKIVPASPGKGKRISYSLEDVCIWSFCLEMSEFGLDPTTISDIKRWHWKAARPYVVDDLVGEDYVMFFNPSLVDAILLKSDIASSLFMKPQICPISEATFERMCTFKDVSSSRVMAVNLTRIGRDLKKVLPLVGKGGVFS